MNFLDQKIGQIDDLIQKKEKMIKLLKEKRAAIINQAVTKGLDPNAKMKPSGIEWIGDIPVGWEIKPVKYVSSIFVPQRNKPELNKEIGIPWITMDDIIGPSIDKPISGNYVSAIAAKDAGSKTLPPKCVIASCIGSFGVASVNQVQVVINQQLQAYIPRNINPWFLRYFILISNAYFERVATSTTLLYVNREHFGELPIAFPTSEEQEKIVRYLEKKTAELDDLIGKIESAITKLREYRSSIITAAVTGKIDVREVS